MDSRRTEQVFPGNRDVGLIKLAGDLCMVVACDSAGGIGEKQLDAVKVPSYVLGRFTLRVALMEVLSVGADPCAVTAAICSEPSPTGEGVISGIKDELKSVKMDLPIVISTEKNIPTCQTGLGVTVIGTVHEKSLRMNNTQKGDRIYCIGIPKVGNEVRLEDPEIADSMLVKELLNQPLIHDIIPVGSGGIKREAEVLASHLGLSVKWRDDLAVDIMKSGGPNTCVIATGPEELHLSCAKPVSLVGMLS
ncbi:MAG TPA: alpha-ribazole kinase [Thermoanaerobacterales bacterium]|nr:alpha-ribazole kinase [Thermoanaerobacterales bacterium]